MARNPHFRCGVRTSFACAFGNWRRKNRIPLKQIARDLGVSIATVSLWESGKRFPGGYNFEMLVEYTGLPPCKLFCVMADKCVPADCLLAMSRITPKRPGQGCLAEASAAARRRLPKSPDGAQAPGARPARPKDPILPEVAW